MGEITNANKISVEKPERKKSVRKPRCRWRIGCNLSGSGQGPELLFCEHQRCGICAVAE
jgi:hypothetical protein